MKKTTINGASYNVIKEFNLDGTSYRQINGRMTARGLVAMCFDENDRRKDIYKEDVIKKYGLEKGIEIFNK